MRVTIGSLWAVFGAICSLVGASVYGGYQVSQLVMTPLQSVNQRVDQLTADVNKRFDNTQNQIAELHNDIFGWNHYKKKGSSDQ